MDTRNQSDLKRLVRERQGVAGLADAEAPAPILAKTAIGRPAGGTGTAGLASPLTEPDASTRQFHPDHVVTTTDSIFTLVIRPIKQIDYLDADNQPAVFKPADPYAVP